MKRTAMRGGTLEPWLRELAPARITVLEVFPQGPETRGPSSSAVNPLYRAAAWYKSAWELRLSSENGARNRATGWLGFTVRAP